MKTLSWKLWASKRSLNMAHDTAYMVLWGWFQPRKITWSFSKDSSLMPLKNVYTLTWHFCYCCWVAKSCPSLHPHGLQHARLLCLSLSPGIGSNSCPLQRRQCQASPVLLPWKSHGQRSLVGCSPWGHEESDPTEQLHFHFSLSCIGEGNGNPLQCSCLENLGDGEAWQAVVYGVTQSRTWLKQLSSSSMSIESVMPSNQLILCHPLLLLPSIFPSIKFFSESTLLIRWPEF